MSRVLLKDLNMTTRKEVLLFLKRLWNEEKTSCPICGNELEILHRKAKKSDLDWQCRNCNKIYRTLNLFYELNDKMPN